MGKEKLSFEQALAKLEQIVSAIESGEIGLEASIERYAEGAKMIAHCREVLDAAEKKIRRLTTTEENTLADDGELPETEES